MASPEIRVPKKLLEWRIPPKVKSGFLLALGVVIALGLAAYVIRLSVRWPEAEAYLRVTDQAKLKSLLDTAALIVTALATLGLVIVAIFGLQQLRLAKRELRIRLEREARSIAIEQCERFAKEIIPAHDMYLREFAALNVPRFDFQGTPFDFKSENAEFLKRAESWVGQIPAETQKRAIDVLNRLETWAMNFNLRIADSEAAYRPASDVFCRGVIELYPFLILLRSRLDPELYSNIQELFEDWQGRKEGRAIADQERNLETALRRIKKLNKPKPHPKAFGIDT